MPSSTRPPTRNQIHADEPDASELSASGAVAPSSVPSSVPSSEPEPEPEPEPAEPPGRAEPRAVISLTSPTTGVHVTVLPSTSPLDSATSPGNVMAILMSRPSIICRDISSVAASPVSG